MASLAQENLTSLAGKVVHDSEKLLGQQIELFRAEIGQEFQRLGECGAAIATGVGLTTGAAILIGFTLADLLHTQLDWPLWCGYGLAAALFIVGAVVLIRLGRLGLSQVQILPPQTAQAVKENLIWLKEQIKGRET